MPPVSHVSHAPHPPLYWRRWTFLANALFNLLFALFTLFGVRFSYAAVSSHPTFVGRIIQVTFWLALAAATVANVLVAAGWLERSYHRWLNILMVCNMFCFGLIATAELLLSLMLRAGFSEPLLVWLLVLPYQFLTVRSAHEAQPPGKLDWPTPTRWSVPRLVDLRQFLTHGAARIQRAAQAFREPTDAPDDTHETDHEQP